MRRFLITSTKFRGQAEAIYNDNETLCKLDCGDTDMDARTVHLFKNAIGATIAEMAVRFSSDTVVIEADYEVSFDMFWKKYNKKINKSRCILLWNKLNKTMQVQAYFGIEAYDKFLKKESWRSKADPETYLRNKYWENEYR